MADSNANPNITLNFYPAEMDRDWIQEKLPIKASTAMQMGTAVGIEISSNTTTGKLTLMGVENAAGADFYGIIAETIASTDADYASTTKLKAVWVPRTPLAEAYFTVGSGTLTAVDVFKTVEFHTDSKSLAVDTPGKGARITAANINGDATRGKCRFVMPNTETA